MYRFLPLISAVLALAGCGFQLQGATTVTPGFSRIFLDVPDVNSDLAFQLRRNLTAAGVTLEREPSEGVPTLRIATERYGRRVKSVSALNRPTEFEVFYEIEYQVSRDTEMLVPRQPIERSRIFPYDERDILGKQQEEELLRDALARDIAGIITRQIADLES